MSLKQKIEVACGVSIGGALSTLLGASLTRTWWILCLAAVFGAALGMLIAVQEDEEGLP